MVQNIYQKLNTMKSSIQIGIALCMYMLSVGFLQAQESKVDIDTSQKIGSATKSEIFQTECIGERNENSTDLKWRQILSTKCTAFEPETPDHEKIEKMKAEKLILKRRSLNNNSQEKGVLDSSPIKGTNYLGNTNNGSSPMDNNIAISNGGWIVSVANTTIEYDDMEGTTHYFNDLVSFIGDPQIENICDPVILYDPTADRFVFFAQECAGSSANSFLLIFFSKTNNPLDGWWYYKITGNPLSDNSWFDYPKMAISQNELYITGNLFYDAGQFNQALIYQINKNSGYSGSDLNWVFWYNIDGSPFTLLPVSHGQETSYGPGVYLVATSPGNSSSIKLYDLTDDLNGSPEIHYYSVETDTYEPAANAEQLNTSTLLDNADCRTFSGFYLDGIIHFVFHCDVGNGWNGINYNRLHLNTLTDESNRFGNPGSFDYSYPSVSSFSNSPTDNSVMIGFGCSSSAIYPEVRVVRCDDNLNWSNSTLIKTSDSYVRYTSETVERWGDYTGTARNHNSSNPSIWMNGMFGTSENYWNTWISEVHWNANSISEQNLTNSINIYPNPVIETFNIEFDLYARTKLNIQILDVNGKIVKPLFNGFGQIGTNVFSFNKSNLSNGIYFLNISSPFKTIINEKIIISN